jgi:molybdenum cofactor synthesis domain-containing protein
VRAEIISVGTELLLGQIVDTNAAYLSRLLPEFGIDVHYRITVGDNRSRLADALRLALSRADIVFTIGGLGPTQDDVTKETVAAVVGDAIELSKRGLDLAREMGAYDVLLWPGQDGFDYAFQVDYRACWKMLAEGISEIASHAPDVRVAVEYKPKEPRAHCFIRNAGTLLYLLKCVDLANVGATIDLGHSFVAGESPAEAAALIAGEGKLFRVHLNDNYRDWDHDLIVGSVHFWETLEFLYEILGPGYDGWYLMDVFPYREDGYAAIQQCVRNTECLLDLAHRVPRDEIRKATAAMDAVSSIETLRQLILGERDR